MHCLENCYGTDLIMPLLILKFPICRLCKILMGTVPQHIRKATNHLKNICLQLSSGKYCTVALLRSLLPHVGSGEYCTLDSFVDFGAIYIVCLFTSPLILFSSLFSYLSTPLPVPVCNFSFENRPAPFPGWRS